MSAIYPTLVRCAKCTRWWSKPPDNSRDAPRFAEDTCPCGGELVAVDMAAHFATLPASTNLPDDVARLERQKAEAAAKKKAAEEAAQQPQPPPTAP